ncbi:MAG: acylphosphatase [Bacteroidales bacterium]|jgi:acylphosphatase|nr:acylphosphatase [Bacteroidales bacterium]
MLSFFTKRKKSRQVEERTLYRIHVTGLVQGVGFRWSAAREAWKLGITGYVKNMPDGSVYLEAEGSREQLDEFAGWCRRGPGMGFVDHTEVTEATPAGYSEFRIEH